MPQRRFSGYNARTMTTSRLTRIVFTLLFSTAVIPAQADENLLRNPGFEDAHGGRARFWDALPGSAGGTESTQDAFQGSRCLTFELGGPGKAGVFQTVKTAPGTLYRISARVKTKNLASSGLGAHIFIPGLNAISNDFSGTTSGWREVTLFVKTDADQTELAVGARVGADGGPAKGRAWFDDFAMARVEPAAMTSAAGRPYRSSFPWGLVVFGLAAAVLLALFARLSLKKRLHSKGPLLDLVLAGGLTLVYGFIAFWNLGSFDAPQTYYRAETKGEGFCVDLGERVPISKVNYFLALGAGSFDLDFSDDCDSWKGRQRIEQENVYSMIEWRTLAVGATARYIRVTSVKPGVMLGEIGAFRRDTGAPAAARGVLGAPGLIEPATDPSAVCDEPGRVPATPSYLNSMYFDETYHARAAYEYVLGRDSTETTHPPLGKLTIAAGVLAFGFHPFGWRFMGALFGVLMVPLMYAFGLSLFKKREYAFAGAFLFAFDFMHFVQTRISTIDVYGVFWIICMYCFMYRALKLDPFGRTPWKYFLFLLLSGLSFGLGAASKWIVLYGGIGLAVVLVIGFGYRLVIFAVEYVRSRLSARPEREIEDDDERPKRRLTPRRFALRLIFTPLTTAALSCVFFIVLPALIYFASYAPFLNVRGPQHPDKSAVALVEQEQKFMYDYHSKLQATHPYSSPWYEWPVMARPIWYYSGKPYVPDNFTSSISAFGNPAVWWPGSLAAAALALILAGLSLTVLGLLVARLANWIMARDNRGIRGLVARFLPRLSYWAFPGLFILAALAAQYLPWIVVPRKLTFIYHFFASVPFIVFCAVFVIKFLLEWRPKARRGLVIYLVVALALFLLFYPILSGWPVPTLFAQSTLKWLPGWVF
ncbi:MAG: phospholipid carrier-dependent glycosyltransferase [Spirochaetales bacterium]|nr:phospholipid carrier-dependent glycosyltransferase [Spirochaetales bacterium]